MTEQDSVTIVIWLLAVSDARLDALRDLLSPDEKARADRMRIKSVARDFIASRGIARELLARECGCEPHFVAFRTGKHGKPYLEHPLPPLAFNLSHSGGYCALAFGDVSRLGVDIEAVRPTVDKLAKNVFTPREVAQYETLDEANKMRAFFRGWVAKEAYLKATGEGLAGGLKSFELHLTTGPEIKAMSLRGDVAELPKWQFRGFDVLDTIVGAIAIQTENPTIQIGIRFLEGGSLAAR